MDLKWNVWNSSHFSLKIWPSTVPPAVCCIFDWCRQNGPTNWIYAWNKSYELAETWNDGFVINCKFNIQANKSFCIVHLWLVSKQLLLFVLFQNTYTNAEKLLEAARNLAKSGECNPEEIKRRVDYFEKRVQEFIERVNRRKSLLQLAVNFYCRTQKVNFAFFK